MKPGQTAAAPAAVCVTYLHPTFFGTVALVWFSFPKKQNQTFILRKKSGFIWYFQNAQYWVKLSWKCDLDSKGCIANYCINAALKQTSYFEHCFGGPSILKYSCGRRERRFEAGLGQSELDQLDQRPPAATDPPAVWARQPLWQQSGPSRPCVRPYPGWHLRLFRAQNQITPISVFFFQGFDFADSSCLIKQEAKNENPGPHSHSLHLGVHGASCIQTQILASLMVNFISESARLSVLYKVHLYILSPAPTRGHQFRAILCLCNNEDIRDMYSWQNFNNHDAANNVCRRIRPLKPLASNLRSRRPHGWKAPRTIFKITLLF
jgi:hypothetical protein